MMKHPRTYAAALAIIALAAPGNSMATPTQEEVFQSINQNVGSTVDISKAVPYLLIAIALGIMFGLYNHHRKRRSFPRRLNSPGKLSREICRRIRLRPAEYRQLKLLADDQQVEHPLTLILCPSLLGKGIRSQNVRIDKAVVKQIVSRLKESLAERG